MKKNIPDLQFLVLYFLQFEVLIFNFLSQVKLGFFFFFLACFVSREKKCKHSKCHRREQSLLLIDSIGSCKHGPCSSARSSLKGQTQA